MVTIGCCCRAYTAGLQEYIEAFSFYHYLCYDNLVTWETVQKELTFEFVIGGKKQKEGSVEHDEMKTADETESQGLVSDSGVEDGTGNAVAKEPINDDDSKCEASEMDSEQLKDGEVPGAEEKSGPSEGVDPSDHAGPKKEPMIVLVPQSDFILGLGDLTGELMRNAINSGEMEDHFHLIK